MESQQKIQHQNFLKILKRKFYSKFLTEAQNRFFGLTVSGSPSLIKYSLFSKFNKAYIPLRGFWTEISPYRFQFLIRYYIYVFQMNQLTH